MEIAPTQLLIARKYNFWKLGFNYILHAKSLQTFFYYLSVNETSKNDEIKYANV